MNKITIRAWPNEEGTLIGKYGLWRKSSAKTYYDWRIYVPLQDIFPFNLYLLHRLWKSGPMRSVIIMFNVPQRSQEHSVRRALQCRHFLQACLYQILSEFRQIHRNTGNTSSCFSCGTCFWVRWMPVPSNELSRR